MNDPKYPKTTLFSTFCIAFDIFIVLAHGWQTIPGRGVVMSRKPLKFLWVPTISLERLIVSGAVNLGGR